MEPMLINGRKEKLNSTSKNVTFSRLGQSRHSVASCQQLPTVNSHKINLAKSRSLMSDLSHLETTSNHFFSNYSNNNKPVRPIIQFPDEPEPETVQKPKTAPKPLKTILKNPIQAQNQQLPTTQLSHFTYNRDIEIYFPDDRSRTFSQDLGSKKSFLNSMQCDTSCSSSFSSNFGHAYVHNPKSQYLIEPKRRWSYDYIKREPEIPNPDIDSPYLITESKMLSSKKKCFQECEQKNFIFNFLTSLAQCVYVFITNFKYLFIFYLAIVCCFLAFSIRILLYFLFIFKQVIKIMVLPFRYVFIDRLFVYMNKNINERRKYDSHNLSNSIENEISNGILNKKLEQFLIFKFF